MKLPELREKLRHEPAAHRFQPAFLEKGAQFRLDLRRVPEGAQKLVRRDQPMHVAVQSALRLQDPFPRHERQGGIPKPGQLSIFRGLARLDHGAW